MEGTSAFETRWHNEVRITDLIELIKIETEVNDDEIPEELIEKINLIPSNKFPILSSRISKNAKNLDNVRKEIEKALNK